jgi:glycerate-2-kinase
MVEADRALADDALALARGNRRFHRQVHLASHNRFLVQQLDLVHRSMALLATSSLAVPGRAREAVEEHEAVVRAVEGGTGRPPRPPCAIISGGPSRSASGSTRGPREDGGRRVDAVGRLVPAERGSSAASQSAR